MLVSCIEGKVEERRKVWDMQAQRYVIYLNFPLFLGRKSENNWDKIYVCKIWYLNSIYCTNQKNLKYFQKKNWILFEKKIFIFFYIKTKAFTYICIHTYAYPKIFLHTIYTYIRNIIYVCICIAVHCSTGCHNCACVTSI